MIDQKYNSLLKTVDNSNINIDRKKLEKAWSFTKLAHTGQKRFSGEPYEIHPLETAIILASWGMDEDSIIAGLLHDTIEDGGAKREDLIKEFGEPVALLVDGITKVTNLRLKRESEEHFIENLRKMVLFMAKDIRVVIVKLADRLHNMRTLQYVPKNKQPRIAKETLDVYAPLAERLGMGEVSGELSDLAFKYLYPIEYEKTLQGSKRFYKEAGEHIDKMRKVLTKALRAQGVAAEIEGRKKRLYSLYKKSLRKNIEGDYERIHDIVALRILVDSPSDCYAALGVVHANYKPNPNLGISDFIAQPKPNGYRSIHTKVFGPEGRVVEVQIRTHEMHEQAEYGVAAHWAYSQAKELGVSDKILEQKGVVADREKLNWVKQLVEWQGEIRDSKEYLSAVKFDALNHRNFIFSPKGDVFDLPAGATPVDFAYAVHTKLAQYLQGARVNGRIVPLDYEIQSGDVVEILKSKNPHAPNRDWLRFVVTTSARRQISKELRKKE